MSNYTRTTAQWVVAACEGGATPHRMDVVSTMGKMNRRGLEDVLVLIGAQHTAARAVVEAELRDCRR